MATPIKMLIPALLLTALTAGVRAQNTVPEVFHQLVSRYQSPEGLRFRVDYRTWPEHEENNVLDSLSGAFETQGTRYRYVLNQTESIGTGDYLVILFREDSLMYLTRPAAGTQPLNPLATLDSLLSAPGIHTRLEKGESETRIAIDFDSTSSLRQTVYHIDNRTGLLDRVTSLVNASLLYDPEAQKLLDPETTLVVVEMRFSGYAKGISAESRLSADTYFSKSGNQFVPATAYHNYSIFLGNPNL